MQKKEIFFKTIDGAFIDHSKFGTTKIEFIWSLVFARFDNNVTLTDKVGL
jgi:hypothetical protein